MWIGTWSGLYLLTPSEKIKFLNNQKPNLVNLSSKFGEPNLCVFRITKDNDGYLWLSTSTGIYCYQPGSNMFDGKIIKKYINNATPQKSLTDYYINDILIEKGTNGEKSIWVATKNGLNNIRINGKKETIRKFYKSSDANGLRENFVSFLYKSKDNQIYLGMLGGGLGKIISGRKENEPLTLKTYSTDDGLRNNDVETLLEDKEGNLWLAGEGLTKFNPKDETYRYYDVRDGLQSNSFKVWAAYKTSSGEMMFGGTNGFNIFNPDSIKDNLIAPKVALTDFKISNKSVNVLKEINGRIILESNLNYTKDIYLKDYENDISIEFAALQYASPENNRYKYILEGFEDNYNNVRSDKRFATYTNLAPGDYVFKVLASNSDGIWIKKPVSINIHIAKPWLLTNLALFIYLFLFIVIFYLIRRYSLISINEKHQLVLERLEHKKNDEMIDLKTQFFTSMSHEFRTPLTLIVDPVNELYRQSKDNKDYQNKLETIKYSTDRLLHLVDQMIDFRKIDKGHLKLEIGKYNISKLISDVKVNFNLVAEKRSINFTYQPIDYEVWMDKDRMENVLFNILSNAFNYTKNGGKIEIKCSLTDEHLEIVINDNGVGIPKSQLDEIFVEFFRDKKQVINKSGSGGIGLFFVKSIIDEHHGKIEVESQENTFTKFTIKLLRGNNHFNEEQLIEFEPEEIIINNFSTDKENEAIEFNHILKHKTVLVVEDNKDVREYLIAQLKPYYQVLDAENGLQGIKIASIEMPDIIVSDIMMPGIDGIALCQRIKTNIETSHIPVILLTAKTADEQKIKGFEVGADDYITKPFSSNILISRINNILKNREIVINRLKNSPSISPSEVTITPLDEKLLQKVINLVEENISDEGYSVEKLSSDAGVSRPQLYRKLKVLTDMSINEFIRNIRLKRAANLLKQDDSSVSNVMYEVGYSNKSYFTKTFSEMFGVNPKEYKKSRIKFDENSNQTTDS
jgi:signal transduction histidine kinase/DNA-binding response OmpR family regulator